MPRILFPTPAPDLHGVKDNWIAVTGGEGLFDVQAGLLKLRGVEIFYGRGLRLETAVALALQEAERLNIPDVWVLGVSRKAALPALKDVMTLEEASVG